MIDRKQLKANAKARMAQAIPRCWQVMLVWTLVSAVAPSMISLVAIPVDAAQKLSALLSGGIDPYLAIQALQLSSGQIIASGVLSLVVGLCQMVLGFGLMSYCLKRYRGEDSGVSDLFVGFAMPGRVIGQQILVDFIAVGCVIILTIPATMLSLFAAAFGEIFGGMVFFAALAGGVALFVAIMLNYVLATTALADQPELGAMGAIQLGKNLIRGHKWQYVALCLSFWGWALLCAVPSGVFNGIATFMSLSLPGWAAQVIAVALMLPFYLWLMPYMNLTLSGFYHALREVSIPPLSMDYRPY